MASTAKTPTRRSFLTLTLVGATAPLAGCIVLPPRRPYPYFVDNQHGVGEGEYVDVAPPLPQAEVVVAAPGPGYVWVAGHWGWYGGRHHWVAGRWVPGRRGYVYVQPRWHHHPRGWRLAPGYWSRG